MWRQTQPPRTSHVASSHSLNNKDAAEFHAFVGGRTLSSMMAACIDQVTMARESAMLGEYATALVYFEGVLDQLGRHASLELSCLKS